MSVKQIQIILNGFPEKVPEGATLSSIIQSFEDGDADLIVELNGRFIYPQEYGQTVVSDGDRCEFIHPNFGG